MHEIIQIVHSHRVPAEGAAETHAGTYGIWLIFQKFQVVVLRCELSVYK